MSLKVKKAYESYNIDTASRTLYDFFWVKYCDWYIELSKIRMMSEDLQAKKQVLKILAHVLKVILQLLSPVMRFITSEIWQILGEKKIIAESEFLNELKENDKCNIEKMKSLQDIIIALRTIRSKMNISPAQQIEALFNVLDESKEKVVKENESYVKQLAKLSSISFAKNIVRPKNSALAVVSGFEIFLPLEGLIDIEKEKTRLLKDLALAKQEIEKSTSKLQNDNFINRAPSPEIEKIKTRLNEANIKLEKVSESLKFLD